jgi:pimeloyl-ACP methyl ester carboxylesterase
MKQLQKADVNGHALSYFEFGNSDSSLTLVILHGWGLSASLYLEMARLISKKGYRVIVIDLPGFGYSTAPQQKWSYENYADCISKFMYQVIGENQRASLLGHSFGGGVSISLAYKYPSQINKLILVDSAGIPLNLPIVVIGIKKGFEMFLQSLLPGGFYPIMKMIRVFISNVVRNALAMYHAIELPNKHNLEPLLADIKVPVSILWGKEAISISFETGVRMSDMTKAQIIPSPNFLYHDWCITHPDIFVEHLPL